jgi:hypothetical protein
VTVRFIIFGMEKYFSFPVGMIVIGSRSGYAANVHGN